MKRRKIWDRVEECVDPENFSHWLCQEYPQTTAVILSILSPEYSGKVIGHLPENYTLEAVMRIARMEPVHDLTITVIEEGLQQQFFDKKSKYHDISENNVDLLGEIFRNVPKSDAYIDAIGDRNRELSRMLSEKV